MDILAVTRTRRSSLASSVVASERNSQFSTVSEQSQLSKLEKTVFSTILKEHLSELEIIQHVYPLFVDDVSVKLPEFKNIEERYGNLARKKPDEPNYILTNEKKFQKDLGMICSLLKNCARHVKKSGDFTELMRYLDILETTKNDEENLLLDYAQKVAFKREIKNMISEEYGDFKEKIFRTVNEIHKSKIELEHIESVSKCQCGYIARWERARQSQNRLKISRVEQFYYHTMKDIKRNIENEAVAHNEVKNFIKEQSEDYFQQIEEWRDKYERDIEIYDSKIYNIKVDRENLSLEFDELKTQYERREEEMAAWLVYKKEKLRRLKAATRIQAWWRGVMVRRCLGPFKKQKKKGKGKKGKEKGLKGKGKEQRAKWRKR